MGTKKKSSWGGAREGSGRKSLPEGTKKVTCSVALTPQVIAWMDVQAAEKDQSRSKWLEERLRFGMKRVGAL